MFENKYHGGRPIRDCRTASKKSYNRFMEENPSIKISFKQFEKIIRTLNKEYSLYIVESGEVINLPYGLGPFAINKKKNRKVFSNETGDHIIMPVDWGTSIKEGKLIYHFNTHTDGYHCKWYWMKYSSRLRCPEIWQFIPSKENSILLSEYLLDTNKQQHLKYRQYLKY